MSIVDSWNWNKLKATEETDKVTADEKVKAALYDFQSAIGIRPNRITIGCNLVDELAQQFYYQRISTKRLTKEERAELSCEYEGIPIKIDYDNPDVLEVGYMMKLWD